MEIPGFYLMVTVIVLADICSLQVTCDGGRKSNNLLSKNGSVCEKALAEFSDQVSAFTSCSVLYARPFTMCENCEKIFTNASLTYENLKTSVENDSTTCEELILNSDKIRIVQQVNTFANQIWLQSKCPYCFTSSSDGKGGNINVLSNDTVSFNMLLNETLECIRNNTNLTDPGSLDDTDAGNTSAACHICAKTYDQLNKFYNTLAGLDNLCMDIVDKMNISRTLWSTKLDCVHRGNPTVNLYIASVTAIMLPVVLYLITWRLADRQERSLAPQKRLLPNSGSTASLS